jgi:exonuclease SbcC
MKIELKEINLKNFKGIKNFSASFGKNSTIIGGNAKGKSTVMNAFFWILFNKDQFFNQLNEQVKPNDDKGQPVHNLETKVEVLLQVKNEELKLAKTLSEKWTKKRGDSDATLTGHEIKYFVNEVPTMAGAYKQKIKDLIDEDLFKLLCSATYFNEKLKWNERRELFSKYVDSVDFGEILLKDEFSLLRHDLADYSPEEMEKIYNHKIKELKKAKIELPARIDEAESMVQDIKEPAEALKEQEEVKTKIESLKADQEKANDKRDLAVADFERQIKIVMTELRKKEDNELYSVTRELKFVNADISSNLELIRNTEKKLKEADKENEKINSYIADLEKRKLQNRNKYINIMQNGVDKSDVSHTCPTCSQALPAEQVLKAIEKDSVENLNVRIEKYKKDLISKEAIQERITAYHKEVAKLETKKEELSKKESLLIIEIAQINKDLELLKKEGNRAYTMSKIDYSKEIEELQNKSLEIQKQVAGYEESLKIKERVKELRSDLKANTNFLMEYEQKIELLKEAKRQFIEACETPINKLLGDNMQVKLFNEQNNGGYTESFEILIKNDLGVLVPYSQANTAGQINCGLKIVDILSNKTGFSVPVWVDNTESVENLEEIESQIIALEMQKGKSLEVF